MSQTARQAIDLHEREEEKYQTRGGEMAGKRGEANRVEKQAGWGEWVRKGGNYLFYMNLYRVCLFRLPLRHWEPRRYPLMVRGARCSMMTTGLVDRYFSKIPRIQRVFQLYLKTGAEGWLVHNNQTWMGFTWSVDLSLREQGPFGRPRRFTYIGLPRDYEVEETSWFGFTAEVNPKYQGKGVFLHLLDQCYGSLRSRNPDGVIYSAVLPDNSPSIKTKVRMGEVPVGLYRAMDLRILGRHFSNVYRSRLREDQSSGFELSGGVT